MYRFANIVALAESQTAAHGSASAGGPHGVEGVDVEGQVDWGVGTNVGKSHLDDAADTVAGTRYRSVLRWSRPCDSVVKRRVLTGQRRTC